ncbi:MAG TPA: hypothetical protein VJM57_09465 [Thermodesulfobacteriota bacterium]|nr:hypothetical protein [Thermodesulfobacteriota bacterium]
MLVTSSLVFAGCVSKGSYLSLEQKLVEERAARIANQKALEAKLDDKSNTINELTERYMAIQKEKEGSRAWINGFRGELESLSRDLAELKLVISSNIEEMKTTMANEMLIKIIDMENRIGEMLKKGEEGPGQ